MDKMTEYAIAGFEMVSTGHNIDLFGTFSENRAYLACVSNMDGGGAPDDTDDEVLVAIHKAEDMTLLRDEVLSNDAETVADWVNVNMPRAETGTPFDRLKLGQRVHFTREYGDYPLRPIPAGSAGTVAEIDGADVWILLDQTFPDLVDWDNRIQVSPLYNGLNQDGTYPVVAETQ